MADLISNRGLTIINSSTVFRALLERSTSSWTPDKDQDYLDDLTGLVEITSSGYSRFTMTGFSFTPQDGSDLALLTFDTLNFGSSITGGGQIVKSVVVYAQVGGDDTTPEDDIFFGRYDTFTNPSLPRELGNGAFTVTLPSGLLTIAQA